MLSSYKVNERVKPMASDYHLETINLELTTACPLRCPQCYCTLKSAKHIDLDIAKRRVDEAAALGARVLLLSGGETMCYPHLYELIRYSSIKIKEIKIAISGCFFTQIAFDQLVAAGVTEISVSLNGSTPEINALTRDGYEYAIAALELLHNNKYPNTVINWVMHSNNTDDFPNLIALAEKKEVREIFIIGLKPDSNNQMNTFPTCEQIKWMSGYIRQYSGSVHLSIDACFSNMLAYFRDTRLFGNLNISDLYKGCGAGRNGLSVTVSGALTPCRHIMILEEDMNMGQYWGNSSTLAKLRNIERDIRDPCKGCKYMQFCRHCIAINWTIHNELYIGFDGCPVYTSRTK